MTTFLRHLTHYFCYPLTAFSMAQQALAANKGQQLFSIGKGRQKRAQTPWTDYKVEKMWETEALGVTSPLRANFTI